MTTTTDLATVNPDSPPQQPPQNNPFAFLLSIPQCLLNSLLNFNKKLKNKAETAESVKRADSEQAETSAIVAKNPDGVRFPLVKQEVPPIKLETEEVREDTNPIILWQVYALGGFIVLKWAWGKWQEMKANAKDKDDSDSPSPSPHEVDPPAAED